VDKGDDSYRLKMRTKSGTALKIHDLKTLFASLDTYGPSPGR
jgi:hypothetical protein